MHCTCGTSESLLRSSDKPKQEISMPSMLMLPLHGSMMRKRVVISCGATGQVGATVRGGISFLILFSLIQVGAAVKEVSSQSQCRRLTYAVMHALSLSCLVQVL